VNPATEDTTYLLYGREWQDKAFIAYCRLVIAGQSKALLAGEPQPDPYPCSARTPSPRSFEVDSTPNDAVFSAKSNDGQARRSCGILMYSGISRYDDASRLPQVCTASQSLCILSLVLTCVTNSLIQYARNASLPRIQIHQAALSHAHLAASPFACAS